MYKRMIGSMLVLGLCLVPVSALAQEDERIVRADQQEEEAALIAVLQSDADWLAKEEACRTLQRVGSAESVPALAALLNDDRLAHHARYALENMDNDAATQALIAALDQTSGLHKMGVAITLGAREDAAAVDALIPLLADSDQHVAQAAAGALGRIATPEAVTALQAAAPSEEQVQIAVAEGLLTAGQQLSEAGEAQRAADIHDAILAGTYPEYVKLGAYRGKVSADNAAAHQAILDALSGDDTMMQNFAAQMIAETSKGTDKYAKALPDLSAEGQVAVLRGLGGRKDAAARPAVHSAVESEDMPVKIAALHALGQLGTAEDVALLVGLLDAEEDAVADAAQSALFNLRGQEVNAAIAGEIANATPVVKVELLEALSQRMAAQSVPQALEQLKSENEEVRIAALNALAQQGGLEEADDVVGALTSASESAERAAAAKALGTISAHQGDAALPIVLEGMPEDNPAARIAMIRTLDQIGSTKALDAVVAELDSTEERIPNEAAQVLANWPSQEAAPHLLKLAQDADSPHKTVAMRGYVRLAREEGDLGKKTEMLTTALNAAGEPAEKFTVLGAWGTVPTPQALDVLTPLLDDASVKNEAAAAIIAVAEQLGKADEAGKTRSVEALNQVVAKVEEQALKERAQGVLASLQ